MIRYTVEVEGSRFEVMQSILTIVLKPRTLNLTSLQRKEWVDQALEAEVDYDVVLP